jgi:hypothetical protein
LGVAVVGSILVGVFLALRAKNTPTDSPFHGNSQRTRIVRILKRGNSMGSISISEKCGTGKIIQKGNFGMP